VTEGQRKVLTLRRLYRAAWKDGWVAAWLVVTALNMTLGWLGATPQWVLGAFFGGTIGMVGGYMVTQQRNYRRTKREDLEFQADRLKDIELRTIARPTRDRDMMLEHIHDSQRQINEALKELA
jgi:hypothetical protein